MPYKRPEWEKEFATLIPESVDILHEIKSDRIFCSREAVVQFIRNTLNQHHQDLISEVVEELGGMKRDQDAPKPDDPHFTGCGGCGEAYPAICGCREVNQALTEAQTIIKSK